MDFDFVIPLSIDGLQEASSSRQYAVVHISSSKEIPQRLQECVQSFRKDGSKFIVDQNSFDALYSVLIKFNSIDERTSMKVWELMIKVMEALATDVHNALEDNSSHGEDALWLLALKMNTYIACNLTEAFESHFNKPSNDIVLAGKRGKKGRVTSDSGVDWEEERTRMLVQLFSLIQSPLNRLWDPPVIDEDFVNLIANCCYKILETSSMNLVRTKAARDTIFQIIGTLVKKFNHGLACSLKFMQLLQHFEHLVAPAAQGIIILVENYGAKGVLQEMIREIIKVDGQEFKDSSGLRNYSQFLQEVAEQCPSVFIPSLPFLITFLDQDAYTMRNCVLYIMGSIVLRVLKGENLDAKSKMLRDDCLEYLQEHIHDTNSFVRSKVLQIWVELIDGQAVPLLQQPPVLKKVIGRLRDKSSNVRKCALHLLASFLKANPFAAKLPIEDLEKQFEAEMKILEEIRPGVSLNSEVDEDEEFEVDSSVETTWVEFVPAIIGVLIKKVPKEGSDMEDSDDASNSDSSSSKSETNPSADDEMETIECILPDNFSLNDGVSAVGEALRQKKIGSAVLHLQKVMQLYEDDEVLQVDIDDDQVTYKDMDKLSKSQKKKFLILHRIFCSFMKKKQMEEENETAKGKEKAKKEMEFKKQKILCCYLRDCVNFARDIQKSLPDACQLLASRQITDVMEAIDFFVTAFEFGVLGAITGVRRMLVLIWSKEQAVKDAVVNAYRRLYINIEAPNERARAFLIVQNLTSLITGATLGEFTSMEEIVAQFYQSGDINRHCITLLWERFTKALPDTTDAESRSSLILLTMAANSESSIISSNLNILTDIGLGERGDNDYKLVKVVCSALCKLAPTKLKTDDPNPPLRFEKDHEMFIKLRNILVSNLFKESNVYCPMAVEAINTIYLLAEHPDVICENIIQDMYQDIKEKSVELEDNETNSQNLSAGVCVSVPTLSRFLMIIGHVALRQLIHLDSFIFTELKRRNCLREEQESKKKSQKMQKKLHRKSINATSASEISVNRSQEPDIDEEMGLTGAVADDMEADYIRSICETEIVKGDSLLSTLKSFIVEICSNPTKYSDPAVRTSAALALAKFMLVSVECCEENLQLLFTILEKSEEATIRANTIIAIGDLTFRFPNMVEPWTPRIYARLRDESTFVRRNVLTVLTHLILNDQVKVKGQISDIALCLTDEDARLAGLAKLFFNELSKKGNALYNVLPDIISRLTDTEIGTEEENFRNIMLHIFGLIQKDRQLESFIEKLCYRLQATIIPRQWRDITYCLSLLPYTDKGIRKLSENFRCYSDKLHEEGVYTHFATILATAKKSTKQDAKAVLEEFESKLEECRNKMVENENLVSKARNVRNKTQSKKGTRKASRRTRKSDSDSESQSDEEFVHKNTKENVPPVSQPRRTSLRKSTVEENKSSECEGGEKEDSSSDSSDEVFEKRRNTRMARTTKAKRK